MTFSTNNKGVYVIPRFHILKRVTRINGIHCFSKKSNWTSNMTGNDNFNSTTTTTTTGAAAGLVISTTETIRSFLKTASTNPNLSQDLRDLASALYPHSSVPYRSLKSIWIGSDPKARPSLVDLLSGSNFIFTSPKPREKSEELKARLRKLAEVAEKKEYEELVKDITPKKGVEEPFSSYKDQLGLGLHVAVTMFTGYLVGYAAFRALFSQNVAMSAAGGILGLVGGMLVETLLFIIRSTNQDRQPTSFSSRSKKDQ